MGAVSNKCFLDLRCTFKAYPEVLLKYLLLDKRKTVKDIPKCFL